MTLTFEQKKRKEYVEDLLVGVNDICNCEIGDYYCFTNCIWGGDNYAEYYFDTITERVKKYDNIYYSLDVSVKIMPNREKYLIKNEDTSPRKKYSGGFLKDMGDYYTELSNLIQICERNGWVVIVDDFGNSLSIGIIFKDLEIKI